MEFALKPYKELIAMTEAAIDEMLVPVRAKLAKSRAQQASAEIEEQILTKQKTIQQLAVKKEINFTAICDELDDIGLLERKKEQLATILAQLFPEAS